MKFGRNIHFYGIHYRDDIIVEKKKNSEVCAAGAFVKPNRGR